MDNSTASPLKRANPPKSNLENFDFLQRAFSDARLKTYLDAIHDKKQTDEERLKRAIRLYEINIIYCECLYSSLHTLEISLRNSIDKSLCNQYDNIWFISDTYLFKNSISKLEKKYNINILMPCNKYSILLQYEEEKIIGSLEDVIKDYQQKKPLQCSLKIQDIRDEIISNLTLGFWTTLLTQTKKQGSNYEHKIFVPCIKMIFPYAKNAERHNKTIQPVLTEIKNLRNRVFHHEPVWFPNYIKSKYDNLHRVMQWIEPELEIWLKRHSKIDRFMEVYESLSTEVISLTQKKSQGNIKKFNYEEK
jgi:hypothetical protein